eukprot:1155545-Pelagomonas_calceolata.AAC.15
MNPFHQKTCASTGAHHLGWCGRMLYGVGVCAAWPAMWNLALVLIPLLSWGLSRLQPNTEVDREAVWMRALAGIGYEEAVLYCHQATGWASFIWVTLHGKNRRIACAHAYAHTHIHTQIHSGCKHDQHVRRLAEG